MPVRKVTEWLDDVFGYLVVEREKTALKMIPCTRMLDKSVVRNGICYLSKGRAIFGVITVA